MKVYPNEIRLGVYLVDTSTGIEFNVSLHELTELSFWDKVEEGIIQGIPLTNDWFAKLGQYELKRKNVLDQMVEYFEGLTIRNFDGNQSIDFGFSCPEIKSVHSLQNAFLYNTGKELIIQSHAQTTNR